MRSTFLSLRREEILAPVLRRILVLVLRGWKDILDRQRLYSRRFRVRAKYFLEGLKNTWKKWW